MEDLIKALQIFLKYENVTYPTNCSHDVLAIMDIEQDQVSDDDTKELEKLGFSWSDEEEVFISFRYGSA